MSSRKARQARQQAPANGKPAPSTHRARRHIGNSPTLPGILLVALLMLGIVGVTAVTAARRTPTSAASVTAPPQPIAKTAQVLVYVPEGQPAWQTQALARVERETEFQYEGRLFYIDANGTQWRRENVNIQALAEADRFFAPANWRFPESGDVVRFVDADGRHRFHQIMDRMAAGDRFWFQGVLYAVFANPQNPQQLGYQPAGRVLDGDGQAVSTVEYVARHGGETAIIQTQDRGDPRYSPAVAAAVVASANGAPEQLGLMPRLNPSPAMAVAASAPAPPIAPAVAAAPAAGSGLPTDYLFTGQKWDSATGLYKMGNRYYDPVLGRFISPDPLIPDPGNPQDLNRYSYVRNNPLNYTDPSGNFPLAPVAQCFVTGTCQQWGMQMAQRASQWWTSVQALLVTNSPQLTQAGEQASHVIAQQMAKANSSGSPNMSGPPEDPFRNIGESIRKGVETLRRQIDNPANTGYGRYGAQAHLSRAEYYMRQGTLQSVNATGEGSIDLLLSNSTGVEVKYWQAQTVVNDIGTLADQLRGFNKLGLNQIVVEFVQTQGDPVTQAVLSRLQQRLVAEFGMDLSKYVFTIVSNPGIP